MSTAGHGSLADHLRGLTDVELAALLEARPDLAVPVPADLSALAERAHTRMSVARALDLLDRFELEVVDALRLAADGRRLVAAREVAALAGPAAPELSLRRTLNRLVGLALVWPDGDTLRLAAGLDEAGSPYPAGLGRPVGALVAGHTTAMLAPVLAALGLPAVRQPEAAAVLAEAFGDPAWLRSVVDRAPDKARSALDRLVAGPPVGTVRDARRVVTAGDADTPVRWLLAHGLLVAVDDDTVELPREVGLLLRGDAPLGPLHPAPPPVTATAVAGPDEAGASQVLEVLRWTAALLDRCAAQPPGVLRAGGVPVRDLRRLAQAVGVDDGTAVLLLEVAQAAGLLDQVGGAEPGWLPTTAYDVWTAEPPERRWSQLARAWLTTSRMPGRVGRRDDRDRPVPALSPEAEHPAAPEVRRLALGVLAEQPEGFAVPTSDVVAVLGWRAPRRGGRARDETTAAVLTEAGTLGVTARGALTRYGRTLLAKGEPAPELAGLLPRPLDHVLVQADLTVVAPGPLEPELAADLALVADLESAGGATVYRVTPDSVRRALDAGQTAADLHALFRTRSRTPVPQALSYLVDDVARRHGGLRSGAAGAYLRSDDPAVLAEVLADRRCAPLRLRPLAPTVLVTPLPLDRLLTGLREAGHAPVPEDDSGALVASRGAARRAPARTRAFRPAPRPGVPDEAYRAEAVRALRHADAAARAARRSPVTARPAPTDGATTLAVLRRAVAEGHQVRLGYTDAHGAVTARVVRPVSMGAGYLRAEDDRTDTLHTFALHRVTSAVLADP